MLISDVIQFLEQHAPLSLQESYDNAGLITGSPSQALKGALICLDSTEAVIDEAISKNCNLVIAHHPIVFSGLKKLNGNSYVERVIIKAIQNNIAIYAIHTNLDNVSQQGVNTRICEILGIENARILLPKQNMVVMNVAGKNRATVIPVDQQKSIAEKWLQEGLRKQDIYTFPIEEGNTIAGSGMIGTLAGDGMDTVDFLNFIKDKLKAGCVKHTKIHKERVSKIAVCGGSGRFLLNAAIRAKADVFITADFKYHEYFDADGHTIIADVGHFESEQYTIDLIFDLLTDKFSNFAPLKTEVNTNPVNYI